MHTHHLLHKHTPFTSKTKTKAEATTRAHGHSHITDTQDGREILSLYLSETYSLYL